MFFNQHLPFDFFFFVCVCVSHKRCLVLGCALRKCHRRIVSDFNGEQCLLRDTSEVCKTRRSYRTMHLPNLEEISDDVLLHYPLSLKPLQMALTAAPSNPTTPYIPLRQPVAVCGTFSKGPLSQRLLWSSHNLDPGSKELSMWLPLQEGHLVDACRLDDLGGIVSGVSYLWAFGAVIPTSSALLKKRPMCKPSLCVAQFL